MIRLAVSTQYRRVTDRQTNRWISCDSVVCAMHTLCAVKIGRNLVQPRTVRSVIISKHHCIVVGVLVT